MKIFYKCKQSLRFRRWSRKAYAVFCSIGKCVTIGCLSKTVADSSLSKQQGQCVLNIEVSGDEKDPDDDDSSILSQGQLMLLELIQPLIVMNKSYGVAESVDCVASAYFYSIRPNGYSGIRSVFFLCRN